MASAAEMDDLTVLTPTGERCRFNIELETILDGSQPKMVIRKLEREVV